MLLVVLASNIKAQVVTTNSNAVGMEHNVLFNANSRYTVTQNGNGPQFDLDGLFNGDFKPFYTSTAPTTSAPAIIEIQGLPSVHTQTGGWVGWTTRYWQAKNFIIEGYNSYGGFNDWVTIADYTSTDYTGGYSFYKKVPTKGTYTKLRFTFYSSYGTNGRLGISELFFLHPEAMTPYEGLLDAFAYNGDDIVTSNTGNVGIGTNSPVAKLQIESDVIPTEVYPPSEFKDYFKNKDYDVLYLNRTANSNMGPSLFLKGIESETSFSARIALLGKGGANGDLAFLTSATDGYKQNEVMRITHDGNVGIGTIETEAKLDVNGSLRANSLIIDGNDFKLGTDNSRDIGEKTGQRALVHFTEDRLFMNYGGDFEGGVYVAGPKTIFEKNVGIGTTETEGYQLAVKGDKGIIAEKVTVKVHGNWADYVFEDDYKLPTLEEVEKHIEEKGHLQNIPSAEVVAKEGVELGNMNRILLEKIEQLTLYTIQQEKEIKALKAQQKEVEALKVLVKKLLEAK